MTVASHLAPIAADLEKVERLIQQRLRSRVPLVGEVTGYIVSSGGKRLRPVLLLLAAGACGCDAPARLELAAVVEFIHTATLLHDDVVDESGLRRGRPTANASFGNAAAVLVGDFVYSRAFQMMVGVGSARVMEVLADATNAIAEGEVLQLMNSRDPDVDEERYLDVIRLKTAKLFEASARLGAVLAGADAGTETALAEYGMRLGTAFQLIDDVLDYSGDPESIGKSLGDDLAEGKVTLPLIRTMRSVSAAERDEVRSAIGEGGRDRFPRMLELMHASGALDEARSVARIEADRARAALSSLTGSPFRDSLLELASFSVSRSR